MKKSVELEAKFKATLAFWCGVILGSSGWKVVVEVLGDSPETKAWFLIGVEFNPVWKSIKPSLVELLIKLILALLKR